jgi:tetratricopeptide (TPR) repeat protein
MPALYTVATVLRPRTLLRRLAVLAAVGAAACAPRGGAPDDPRDPPELLLEVLPRSAEIALDGRPLGRGGRAIPAPAPGEHVLRVAADGYEPLERALPPEGLAGARVAAALRPAGFGSTRILDYDEAEGLALAAAFLARAGPPEDAVAYADRALALDRSVALAHRALGDARAALGDERRAAPSWAEYLRLSPDAPDAAAVERRLEAVRGDVTLPER